MDLRILISIVGIGCTIVGYILSNCMAWVRQSRTFDAAISKNSYIESLEGMKVILKHVARINRRKTTNYSGYICHIPCLELKTGLHDFDKELIQLLDTYSPVLDKKFYNRSKRVHNYLEFVQTIFADYSPNPKFYYGELIHKLTTDLIHLYRDMWTRYSLLVQRPHKCDFSGQSSQTVFYPGEELKHWYYVTQFQHWAYDTYKFQPTYRGSNEKVTNWTKIKDTYKILIWCFQGLKKTWTQKF